MVAANHLFTHTLRQTNCTYETKDRFISNAMKNKQNCLRACSSLVLLNLRIYRVVWTYIDSTNFVPLSGHLYCNHITPHGILSTLLLIIQLQEIYISQNNVSFILDAALHRLTVPKACCIPQVHVSMNMAITAIPTTILLLLIAISKEWKTHYLHRFITFVPNTSHSLALSLLEWSTRFHLQVQRKSCPLPCRWKSRITPDFTSRDGRGCRAPFVVDKPSFC